MTDLLDELPDAPEDAIFRGRSSWSRPAVDYEVLALSFDQRLKMALALSAKVFERVGMPYTAELLRTASRAFEIEKETEA